jgi:hypothetical protein
MALTYAEPVTQLVEIATVATINLALLVFLGKDYIILLITFVFLALPHAVSENIGPVVIVTLVRIHAKPVLNPVIAINALKNIIIIQAIVNPATLPV